MNEKYKRDLSLNMIVFLSGSAIIVMGLCILTVWVVRHFWISSPETQIENEIRSTETQATAVSEVTNYPVQSTQMASDETLTPHNFERPPAGLLKGNIVYTCTVKGYNQICIMNADGREQKQLTPDQEPNSYYGELSQDGKQIFFVSNRSGNFEIYRMNTDGGDLVRLTWDIGEVSAPDLSPDAQKIVFANKTGGKKLIWIMDADGSDPHPITGTPGNYVDPVWSPDGSRIAFSSDRSGKMAIYIMDPSGNELQMVTDINQIGGRTSWSPDGRSLVFYAGPYADKDVYIVDIKTRVLEQLTDGGNNAGPCYSPDGQWVVFSSSRTGDHEIYMLDISSRHIFQLTENFTDDWQPRWGP